jgi:hypothetical protein
MGDTMLDQRRESATTTRPTTPRPLALSDAQLDAIMSAAKPLAPDQRSDFLTAVAAELSQHPAEVGDGELYRMLITLQRQFVHRAESRALGWPVEIPIDGRNLRPPRAPGSRDRRRSRRSLQTVRVARYRQVAVAKSARRHSVNGAVFSVRPKPGQDTAQGMCGLRGAPCLSIFAWFWRFTPS